MKNVRRYLVLCLLFCVLLTGCQIGNKSIVVTKPLGNRYVFRIGEVSCGVKEAKLYLANYQNIYGEAYTLDLWKHDFGDDSLETYIKALTLNELVSIVCMSQLAVEKGMVLSEEEKDKIVEAASAYYESLTEAEHTYLDVSQEDLETYYERYALAQRVYQFLISEIDGEVSDDEARVMEVMQIYVTDKAVAEEVEGKLRNGEDFASVANNYNELPAIQANICRADLPKSAEEIIFQLDNNETAFSIEVEGGYYFVKCLNKYHLELTEANKTVIIEKREQEAFDNVYKEFMNGLSSYINEDVWESIVVDPSLGIETDSFFDIYESYCEQ